MPKEITHWIIADKIKERLQGTAYEKSVNEFNNCLKFGAVFHDQIYYLPKRKYPVNEQIKTVFLNVPRKLHGTKGEDTFTFISCLLKSIQQSEKKEALAALMIGVVSHIFADVNFHPLVYYFSGDYNAKDPIEQQAGRMRHHRFEAVMDIYFCGGLEKLKDYKLQNYVKNIEVPLPELIKEACRFYVPMNIDVFTKYYMQSVKASVKAGKWIQRIWLNNFFNRIRSYLPDRLQVLETALYNRYLLNAVPKLKGEITYTNPASGINITTTLDELMEKVVNDVCEFCLSVEKMVFEEEDIILAPGPSLEHGTFPGNEQEMQFFGEPFPVDVI